MLSEYFLVASVCREYYLDIPANYKGFNAMVNISFHELEKLKPIDYQ
jgi:hypothetical protein